MRQPRAAPLSTMRRPQGFLSGRLSGVGAKEPLWLPTGDQGRLVSVPLYLPEKVVHQGVNYSKKKTAPGEISDAALF